MFYTIQNNTLLTAKNKQALTRFYDNVKELPTDYEPNKYVVENGELVLNANYSNEQAIETLEKEQTDLDTQISELKESLCLAILANNQKEIESLRAQYQTLIGCE